MTTHSQMAKMVRRPPAIIPPEIINKYRTTSVTQMVPHTGTFGFQVGADFDGIEGQDMKDAVLVRFLAAEVVVFNDLQVLFFGHHGGEP